MLRSKPTRASTKTLAAADVAVNRGALNLARFVLVVVVVVGRDRAHQLASAHSASNLIWLRLWARCSSLSEHSWWADKHTQSARTDQSTLHQIKHTSHTDKNTYLALGSELSQFRRLVLQNHQIYRIVWVCPWCRVALWVLSQSCCCCLRADSRVHRRSRGSDRRLNNSIQFQLI